MPRTAVVPLALTADGVAPGAGTTIDSTLVTNGVSIDCGGITQKIVLRVLCSLGTPKNVIIRRSPVTDYHAHRSSLGDLSVQVPQSGGERIIAGLEGARHIQSGGLLYVDFESGFTGTLRVEELPYPPR